MTKASSENVGGSAAAGPVGGQGEEKRQDRRRKTLKEGKVLLSDWSTVDCTIRDLSSGGANLRFSGPTKLPASFRLLLSIERTVMPVDLLWQRGLSAGVAITGPAQPAPTRK